MLTGWQRVRPQPRLGAGSHCPVNHQLDLDRDLDRETIVDVNGVE